MPNFVAGKTNVVIAIYIIIYNVYKILKQNISNRKSHKQT